MYEWNVEDLPFTADTNLPLEQDPKLLWAEANLLHTPTELNTATRQQLLRIPGIGPQAADAILTACRKDKINDIAQLRTLGVRDVARATPYILLNGRKPPQQLSLLQM